MALVARCPECGAKLGIKDRGSLGKKARCGKCQHVFVLQASDGPSAKKKKSPARDEFDDFGLDDDDLGDDFASPAIGRSPARAGQGGKRGGKKKKKSGPPAWLVPAAIGLGAMLVVGILVGVGFLIAGRNGNAEGDSPTADVPADTKVAATDQDGEPVDPPASALPEETGAPAPSAVPPAATVASSDPSPAPAPAGGGGSRPVIEPPASGRARYFAYLPPNSELVAVVRPREIWNSQPLVELRNEPLFMMFQGMATQSEQVDADQFPVDSVDDVDSVVVGLSGLSAAVDDPEQAQDAVRGLAVIRTSRAIDPARLVNDDSEPAAHSGTDYMRSKDRPEENEFEDSSRPPTAVWQVSPTLLVIGNESEVQAAIDRGAGEPGELVRKFDVLDTEAHFAFAYVSESPGFQDLAQAQAELGDEAPPPLAELVDALVASGESTAFALNFDDAIGPSFRFGFGDEDAAHRAEQSLNGLVSFAAEMAQVPEDSPSGDPGMRQMMSIAQQFLANIVVERDGTRVTLAGSLPNESFTVLRQQAVAAVMKGMGGLEGGPGGPGIDPGPPGIGPGDFGLAPAAPQGIQGEWTITSYEQQGQVDPKWAGTKVTIGDGKFTLTSGQESSSRDCTLDEEKQHLDIHFTIPRTNKPTVDSCIYEIQGDTLRICLGRGGRRPDEFKTARRDNPIRVLMTLTRTDSPPGGVPGIGIAGEPAAPEPEFPQPPEGEPAAPVPAPPAGQQVRVSPDDLAREFIADAAAMPAKYAGKAIVISGTIYGFADTSLMMLSTEKTPEGNVVEFEIQCVPGTTAKLTEGQNVVLLASFGEMTKFGMKLTNGRIVAP